MGICQQAAAAATMAALMGVAGTAQAAFQGRDATGAASATCTATGASKCTYFYDTTLDITILNNWNIGFGRWSATAALNSAQRFAETAGFNASGLTGWVLPTGDGNEPAGPANQYMSIFNEVGNTFAGLSAQFAGVQQGVHWSATAASSGKAWSTVTIVPATGSTGTMSPHSLTSGRMWAVAVRPGDVAPVPEPQAAAMMLLGLGTLMVAVRKRPR